MISGFNIESFWNILNGLIIALGIWMLTRLFWMFIYQLKYGKDYGERYISGDISKEEKRELRKNFSWLKRFKD
jgi:hypothetical protein